MPPYCDICGTKKVPAEENAYVCPACERHAEITHTCDYCQAHVASMPSDDGAWICDHCIMATIVGPAAYAEIVATQSRLSREVGRPVSLGEAFSAWRELAGGAKMHSTSPAKEVKADAS